MIQDTDNNNYNKGKKKEKNFSSNAKPQIDSGAADKNNQHKN